MLIRYAFPILSYRSLRERSEHAAKIAPNDALIILTLLSMTVETCLSLLRRICS